MLSPYAPRARIPALSNDATRYGDERPGPLVVASMAIEEVS
jgi:hypothetical protein